MRFLPKERPLHEAGQAMNTPNITKAQLIAIGTAILDTALAFGVHLSTVQQHVLLADLAVAGALLAGDAVIRQARARNAHGIVKAAHAEQDRNTTQTAAAAPAAPQPPAQTPVQAAQP
jgi:hypothetical protein